MKCIDSLKKNLLLLVMLVAVHSAWAQKVIGNKYKENYSSYTITHKAAKWYDLRTNISTAAKNMDTFDDDKPMFMMQDGKTQIQAAHTYMDTIYAHKGSSVLLEIPDKLNDNLRVESYQRWYSFRTDGTFRTLNTDDNAVWDLLTPKDSNTYYRFSNGYVGKPAGSNFYKAVFYIPTDEEFKAWFGEDAANKYDNNYYLVACDVSAYTDYTKNFSSSSSSSSFPNKNGQPTYEPTLVHRVLFYIVAVDGRDNDDGATSTWKNGMGRLKDAAYQGGTLEDGKKYLEEYDISFPYTRVSNHTLELVALSKDARSYAIPDAPLSADHNKLDVHLVDNGSGITLATTSLNDMKRVIQFNYPNTNPTDKTQYVDADESRATIYVTKTVNKTTYNIARFNLVFRKGSRLLTQSQLDQIENGTIADESLHYFQFRTDRYLENNFQLLTALDFDYDPSVSELYGRSEFYPFPLAWESNSYSFFDGSEGDDFQNKNKYPEWGFYSIMNAFMEGGIWSNGTGNKHGTLLPGSSYHLYVDASDRPGVVARLPFRRKLCQGSELFVTAWLKSAGWNASMDDACMLFSIMGVRTDPVLGTVYEPICRHSSSQVRRTDYLSNMPGTGNNTNEWMQMYFSFIIDADKDYDSFVLQVDSYNASTDGGDMYIDDIRVYMATPSARLTQMEATCISERTLMNIKLDWYRLLSRIGEVEGQNEVAAIDFCFIDKVKYETYLSKHTGDYEGAIEASVVEIGDYTPEEGGYNQKYNTLYFNLDFENNTDYDTGNSPHLAINNEGTGSYAGKYFFYRANDNGNKALSVDFYSELIPHRTYMMLIQINDGDPAKAADFAESIDDDCSINTMFNVTAQTMLRVNGEAIDPLTEFCAGQIFNFSVQLRIPVQEEDGTESYIVVDKGVYFDWFFGSEEEYLAENPNFGGVTLHDALVTFRDFYPENEDLTNVSYSDPVEGFVVFTKDMYDIIDYYINKKTQEDGLHSVLVLHEAALDITLLMSGLKLVIQPIPLLQSPDGSISEDLWARICWEYVPVELNVSGEAPLLRAGFNELNYPSTDFNPGLRIGLKQILETSEEKPIKMNLRGAKLVSEKADHIGMVTSVSPNIYNKIYLVATDDPAYNNETYFPIDFSEYSLPIGVVKSLFAEEYKGGSLFQDFMEFYFDTQTILENGFQFNPKEGYSYTFAVHFEEYGEESSNACFGLFTIDMKIVPENLVWEGTGKVSNWNNDANWKRADAADLRNTDGTYVTNEANTTSNGFVPMLFSNVIMPRDSKAELYIAGFGDGGNGWVNTSRPDYMQLPTEYIQYDLMAYDRDNCLTTERYRVNICRDIHFEPGAQMLHGEQLIYNKAWTDVEIPSGKWTAVSTPLQGVVAGDWYVPTLTGRQETEYFKDIVFSNSVNNRLNPAVYQRSWGKGATIIESTLPNTIVSFGSTDWSSVYNDASVPYHVGCGYSVKAVTALNPLMFRFPKADVEYAVSDGSGDVDRSVAGRLLISDMVDRSDPYTYIHTDEISVALTPSADGRYLMVGNPFVAPLDVQAFMAANSDVLSQKYWLDSDTEAEPAAVYDPETATWSSGQYLAQPYSVFYVKVADAVNNDVPVVVKFTSDMQKLETATDENRTETSFKITAKSELGISQAILRHSSSADNMYGEEDVEIIQDFDGSGCRRPRVYTVAGNKAVCINQVRDVNWIPLGVYSADNDIVRLEFDGVGSIENAVLYDAKTQTSTTLYDGFALDVIGSTYGRYFILGNSEGNSGLDIAAKDNVVVGSVFPSQVVVSSDAELEEIRIWTIDGIMIEHLKVCGHVYTINDIKSGIIIVEVKTAAGVTVRKIVVK